MNYSLTYPAGKRENKMSFSISILDEQKKLINYIFRSKIRYGVITLGNFSEKIETSFTFWKESDYKKQWYQGLTRILSGYPKSSLITSMYNPKYANFIHWWPMYREGENVIFNNQLLFINELSQPFDIENPYIHVDDRYTINEDGMRISEWEVPVGDIQKFLDGMAKPDRM